MENLLFGGNEEQLFFCVIDGFLVIKVMWKTHGNPRKHIEHISYSYGTLTYNSCNIIITSKIKLIETYRELMKYLLYSHVLFQ